MDYKNSLKNTAFYKTQIGLIKICSFKNSIIEIRFASEKEDVSLSSPTKLSDIAIKQINEYLDGKRKTFDLPIKLLGTAFQKSVWEALQKVKYGDKSTYKDIAIAIGNPKACRAVGMANNKNPIAIVVPCHRVVGSNGKLVGYAAGLEIKEKLLNIEKSNS
ncbi:MAG: methylated-DNA--[protein]-cysteine S-methyltransferase [Bacteroidales bacterium]|nr:methylated-DNA--[protein]-cysteine S-methyltransferase [Bacteroidales bacterium]